MNGDNIEGLRIFCFGWCYQHNDPKTAWWSIANDSISDGWETADVEQLQMSLARDLRIGKACLVAAKFKDVGSDTTYVVQFDNRQKKWDIRIPDSKSEEGVPEEDKKIFFKCPIWKNTCRRAVEILQRSKKVMDEVILDHIERGDLPKVNEIDFEKVSRLLGDPELLNNLKLHKYVK